MNEMTLLLRDEKQTSGALPGEKAGPRLRFKRKPLRLFTQTLARLVHGGVPVLRALVILREQATHAAHQSLLLRIEAAIMEGKSIATALRALPGAFPQYYVQMVAIGESSGTLDEVLAALARHLENEEERSRKIREAAAYPCFILMTGAGTLLVLIQGVMPKIMTVYQDFDGELPGITKFTLALMDFFPLIAVFLILTVFTFTLLGIKRGGDWIPWLQRAPCVGNLVSSRLLVRFTSLFSLLLQSGVPLLQAFDMVRQSFPGKTFEKLFDQIQTGLTKGEGISKVLQAIPWMPQEALALVVSGEETGRLSEALGQIAADAQKDFDGAVQVMLKLLEPALILGVGLVVGLVVISMLLPVFELNQLLR